LAGKPDLHETTVANDDDTLPVPNADKWRIEVYPNPFNPSTTITFSIPETGRVRVSVYNIKGRKVKDLINTEMARGNHKLIWDGKDTNSRNVGSGIYLFKLESGGNTSIRKAMLVK
jgi:flagellar hook assembly protein FlgD